ncbi:CAPN15 isoform 4, partial [Pan troglodytes]
VCQVHAQKPHSGPQVLGLRLLQTARLPGAWRASHPLPRLWGRQAQPLRQKLRTGVLGPEGRPRPARAPGPVGLPCLYPAQRTAGQALRRLPHASAPGGPAAGGRAPEAQGEH